MRHPKLDEILRELRVALAAHYGERLAGVVLFGSQARGDARADSDIDVLVLLSDDVVVSSREVHETGPAVARICLTHDVVLACVFESAVRYERRASSLLRRTAIEGLAA